MSSLQLPFQPMNVFVELMNDSLVVSCITFDSLVLSFELLVLLLLGLPLHLVELHHAEFYVGDDELLVIVFSSLTFACRHGYSCWGTVGYEAN